MSSQKLLAISLLTVSLFSGCIYKEEPTIVISQQVPTSQPQWKPPVVTPTPPRGQSSSWTPAKKPENRWETIVIHHSATTSGNMNIFDQAHKDRNWDGVGYHFVIGNGAGSGNGQVEVTYRWNEQKTGAHCGGTPNNKANEKGIGICLVGDFNKTKPTSQQMDSLVKLVNFLKNRYNIPSNRIYGHGTYPGGHATDCPGKNFPMWQVK